MKMEQACRFRTDEAGYMVCARSQGLTADNENNLGYFNSTMTSLFEKDGSGPRMGQSILSYAVSEENGGRRDFLIAKSTMRSDIKGRASIFTHAYFMGLDEYARRMETDPSAIYGIDTGDMMTAQSGSQLPPKEAVLRGGFELSVLREKYGLTDERYALLLYNVYQAVAGGGSLALLTQLPLSQTQDMVREVAYCAAMGMLPGLRWRLTCSSAADTRAAICASSKAGGGGMGIPLCTFDLDDGGRRLEEDPFVAELFRYLASAAPEERRQMLLDDSGDLLQTGTEHHYIQVRCRNENKPLWLVPFRVKREELLRVSDVLEQIQMGRILREGFFWPFDLVRSDEMQGYVLHPFSMDAYPSVRRFLPSSDTPRWTIAVHLFRRIGQLHREGLTLNGFGRDQVRVEYGTNQVYLVPGETISRVSQIGAAFRGDFLSVSQVVEQQLEKNGIVLDGRVRDIFSAAVIAFYLLFYTHPFIGEEYSHLMREQYLEYFQSRPVFLFDAGGHNGTGHHQFGAEITAQWWRAQPALCAGQIDENAPWNDTENWIRCLLEDAAVNDNDKSRTSYELELEKFHLV